MDHHHHQLHPLLVFDSWVNAISLTGLLCAFVQQQQEDLLDLETGDAMV